MKQRLLTRWCVLFAAFLLALMGGVSYAWGVFIIPMTNTFGWSSAEATVPFTAFLIIFAITMVPAGKLQDTFGPRVVSFAGAILFFVAYSLASLIIIIPNPWWLIGTYSVIGGIACGLAYSCVAPPARKWFPDKPGLAISLAVMGFGLAAVFMAPLKANYLIPTYGINGTFFILAAVTSLVTMFASLIIKNPKQGWSLTTFAKKAESKKIMHSKQNLSPSDVVRNPLFLFIWIMFASVSAGGLVAIGIIPAFGEKIIGLTPVQAAIALSFFAALNGFCRPLAGYLSDIYGVIRVMNVTYVIQMITFFSIPFLATSEKGLYLAAAFLGWCYAVTLALFPTLTSICFGVKHMGRNYGLVFTAFGVGAISPVVGSWVFDTTQSYTWVFLLAGVLTAGGLTISLVLKKQYSRFNF